MSVSASGFYAWRDRPLSKRAREEGRLEIEIKAAHKRTRQTYGPERLQHDLAEHGVKVGICRIKRIRKKLGIRCKQKRKFKATTNSRHKLPVAENLLKQLMCLMHNVKKIVKRVLDGTVSLPGKYDKLIEEASRS